MSAQNNNIPNENSQAYSKEVPALLPHHLAQLLKSAISLEVIRARGYRSIIDKRELSRLGFSEYQQRTPCLLIPQFSVDGQTTPYAYQLRPDQPRFKGKGKAKPVKYEFAEGSKSRFDISPTSRPILRDTNIPLWFVEGSKKCDSLASRGQCAISLSGIWSFKSRDDSGSSVLAADFDYIPLNNRLCYLCFDSDWQSNSRVKQAANRLAVHLRNKGAAVLFIGLPMNGTDKNGVDDYLAAEHTIEDVIALAGEDLTAPATLKSSLPKIICNNRSLADKTNEAIAAIVAKNSPPVIFTRALNPVKAARDEKCNPNIVVLGEDEFRCVLAETAQFVNKGTNGEIEISPPMDVVKNSLAQIKLGRRTFPPLIGITESPYIKPNGEIVTTPGYDSESMLLYAPGNDFKIPPMPDNPTSEDMESAVDLLLEVFCDMPFLDQASWANTLALLITPICRPLISGTIPLALITKPEPGTGASLISDTIARLATGRKADMMTAPRDETEWRKQLQSLLSSGRSVVVIDNIESTLASESLGSVLTSEQWGGRILGGIEEGSYPNLATWVGTGNNISLGGDLPRRCYWIKMDAKHPRPWQRKMRFKHPNLLRWVAESRGEIIAAVLTIAKSWLQARKPVPENLPVMGGFDEWVKVLGGILSYAGITGFLGNTEAMYAEADIEGVQWANFMNLWHEVLSEIEVTTGELIKEMLKEGNSAFYDALPASIDRETSKISRSLGNNLSKRSDRRFLVTSENSEKQLILCRGNTKKNAVLWAVKEAPEAKSGELTILHKVNSPPNSPPNSLSNFGALALGGELGELSSILNAQGQDKPSIVVDAETNSLNSPLAMKRGELAHPDITPPADYTAALGMPVEDAIKLWRSEGAPVIHLGPGENCLDLGKLLAQMDVTPEQLEAVRTWLEKHTGGNGQ